MDFWIDVLDPQLSMINGTQLLAVATAGIIETALLNCSHLIAVMSPETRGSAWVPYEYGRVKEMLPVTTQVACWLHPELDHQNLPEYMYLGKITLSEEQINDWLTNQLQAINRRHSDHASGFQPAWRGREPKPLPPPSGLARFATSP